MTKGPARIAKLKVRPSDRCSYCGVPRYGPVRYPRRGRAEVELG